MKLIPIYIGRGRSKKVADHAQVSDVDFDYLSQFEWILHRQGKNRKYVYAYRTVYMHQAVLERSIGRLLSPGVELADHKNGHQLDSGLNNQRDNLRIVSPGQNVMYGAHPKRKGTSGVVGVCWDKSNKKWVARTRAGGNGKRLKIGQFDSLDEAKKAYDSAVRKVYPDAVLRD